ARTLHLHDVGTVGRNMKFSRSRAEPVALPAVADLGQSHQWPFVASGGKACSVDGVFTTRDSHQSPTVADLVKRFTGRLLANQKQRASRGRNGWDSGRRGRRGSTFESDPASGWGPIPRARARRDGCRRAAIEVPAPS